MVSKTLLEAIAAGDFTISEVRLLCYLLSRVTLGSCEVEGYVNLAAAEFLTTSDGVTSRALTSLEQRQIVKRAPRSGRKNIVINPNLASRANRDQRRSLQEEYGMPQVPIVRLRRPLAKAGIGSAAACPPSPPPEG